MTVQGWALIALFVVILAALVKPVGWYLHALYEGRRTPLHFVLGPVEQGFYRLGGIDPGVEQGWRRYALHLILFNLALLLFTYAVLRLQGVLPMNPRGLEGIGADGAFNTAISFATNTNWQWYSGEVALSNFSQMVGLVIHNFLSAATGIAIAFALFRGFARREASGLGNFWADVTRVTLYLLLPACIVYAIVLMAGQPTVFVFAQGAYEARLVEPGERLSGRTVLKSGVKPGDQVVVAGAYELKARKLKSQLGHGH